MEAHEERRPALEEQWQQRRPSLWQKRSWRVWLKSLQVQEQQRQLEEAPQQKAPTQEQLPEEQEMLQLEEPPRLELQ